jgi:hypothetical protein
MSQDPTRSASRARSRLLYAMQQQIVSTFAESEWIELGYYAGAPQVIMDDPVLLPALRDADPAYRSRVFVVLEALEPATPLVDLAMWLKLPAWLELNDPALGRELFLNGSGSALDELDQAAHELDIPELDRQVARIRRTATTDPEIAIGQAKEMLETVMKAILDQHGPNTDIDLIKLVKLTREQLALDGGGASTYRNRTLSNLTQLVEGINKLRNLYGTGHGRSRAGETDPAHAKLVVDSAAALCVFFLEIERERHVTIQQDL